jgi:hypothetical protein
VVIPLGWLWFRAPYAGLRLNLRYVARVLVFLVACLFRLLGTMLCTWCYVCRLLSQIVPHMFLFDRIGDLSCLTEKVEVLAHLPLIWSSSFYATSKSIIVEIIVGFFQLVAQPIVRVFEVNAARRTMSALSKSTQTHEHTYHPPHLEAPAAFWHLKLQ